MTVVTGLVPVTSLRIGNARVNLSGMAGTSPAMTGNYSKSFLAS